MLKKMILSEVLDFSVAKITDAYNFTSQNYFH